ncbi:Mycoplasma protein of unknown function, DUF285 [Seminavis robusta]|uniref:BspA family leucine-rich repeat surface protein n=1 Tax=Seminavis robusta TaxID=568900 RepID=A0A9N8DV17_9STRA|nr:Mycoplasma protein of unknown function, DUF285 [Seminavis robusta]|eukprot:Sro303_g112360.1 Mycoplasma protein of unknown function, DUF285 (109) ;mRNA; f:10802-11402
MPQMFAAATIFNQNIAGWNVAKVTRMDYCFWKASAFNVDISGWAINSVADINGMFYEATLFNQNLCAWAHHPLSTGPALAFHRTGCPSPPAAGPWWDGTKWDYLCAYC